MRKLEDIVYIVFVMYRSVKPLDLVRGQCLPNRKEDSSHDGCISSVDRAISLVAFRTERLVCFQDYASSPIFAPIPHISSYRYIFLSNPFPSIKSLIFLNYNLYYNFLIFFFEILEETENWLLHWKIKIFTCKAMTIYT